MLAAGDDDVDLQQFHCSLFLHHPQLTTPPLPAYYLVGITVSLTLMPVFDSQMTRKEGTIGTCGG